MSFGSMVFLFGFLPLTLALYFAAPPRWRNLVLLLTSLVFYGWGEPRYLPVMLVSILQGYIFGRLIERFRDTRRAKLFLVLSVLLSLGTLAYFKYADFMIANLNALTGLSAPLLRLEIGRVPRDGPGAAEFYRSCSLYRHVPAADRRADRPLFRYRRAAENTRTQRIGGGLRRTALHSGPCEKDPACQSARRAGVKLPRVRRFVGPVLLAGRDCVHPADLL